MNFLSSDYNAYYVECAYRSLENVFVEKESDFKVVEVALECLINNTAFPENLSEKVVGQIHFLKDLIEHPALYIEAPEHYDEFTFFLKTKIDFKRKEIKNLTVDQKKVWIEKCKDVQEKIIMNNKIMTEEITQNYLVRLNEFSGEIIKKFRGYITQLKLSMSATTGISINCKVNFYLNFLQVNMQNLEMFEKFKNIEYELPHLSETDRTNQELQKLIEEDVYKHLNDLLKIGLSGSVIFYNQD